MTVQAKEPFRFYTRQNLTFLTGRNAKNLAELLVGIREAKESSIYYHTHHFFAQHEFLTPEPPNDFAYWISNILQEKALGERVANIDLRDLSNLDDIRSRMVSLIEQSIASGIGQSTREAPPGEEFHFMETQIFVFPTGHVASSLTDFRECLKQVSIQSIYFHVIESGLRGRESDFSFWLRNSLAETKLALEFLQFDPYTQTLENLRQRLIRLVDHRLRKEPDGKPA